MRKRILNGEPRIDGRDTRTVRAIACEIDVLPKAHGSALFTRGETQAIGAVTLGSTRDAQFIESLSGERRDAFMLHYNFPPWSVGEAGRIEVEVPVNALREEATGVTVADAEGTERLLFGPADQYGLQADAFAAAVRSGGPAPTPLADAIANMAVVDAIFASAQSERWESL